MSRKKLPEPEIINLNEDYCDLFMQAVEKTCQLTYYSNNSIHRKEKTIIEIEDTKAFFLIHVGMEYQKLIDNKNKS